MVASAMTGDGIEDLLSAIEAHLPRPQVEVDVLVPYSRGDLVSRAHEYGEVLKLDHTGEGTRLHARVHPDLASELAPYAVAATA